MRNKIWYRIAESHCQFYDGTIVTHELVKRLLVPTYCCFRYRLQHSPTQLQDLGVFCGRHLRRDNGTRVAAQCTHARTPLFTHFPTAIVRAHALRTRNHQHSITLLLLVVAEHVLSER